MHQRCVTGNYTILVFISVILVKEENSLMVCIARMYSLYWFFSSFALQSDDFITVDAEIRAR